MKIAPLFIATVISNVGLSAPLHSSDSVPTPQFQIVLETTIPKAQDLSIELEEIVAELKDGAKTNKRNNYTILLSKIQETLTNEEYTPEPDHALRLLQIERIFLELLEKQEELSERFIEELKKEELAYDEENTKPEKNLQEGSEPFEIGFTPEAPVEVSKNETRGAERTNSFNGDISATSTVSESTVTPAPIASRRTTTLTTTTTISGGVPQGTSNQASGPKIVARKKASGSKRLTNSDEFFKAPSATYVATTGPIRRSQFGSDKPREYAYTPTERVQNVETAPYAPIPEQPAKREISSPIAQAVVTAAKPAQQEPKYEAPLRLEASEFSEEPKARNPQYASTATWLNGFISDYQEEKRESLRKGQVVDPFGPAFVENETIGPYRPMAENTKAPEAIDTQLAKEIIPADPTKKQSGLQRMMSFLDERNG